MSRRNGKSSGDTSGVTMPEKVEQPHGGAIYRGGVPGHRGGGGRPPNEFRRRMAELVSAEETEAYLAECLRGEHGPKAFLGALQFAADRGYGKAPQKIEVTDTTEAAVTVSAIVEEYWPRIQRIQSVQQFERLLAEVATRQANADAN